MCAWHNEPVRHRQAALGKKSGRKSYLHYRSRRHYNREVSWQPRVITEPSGQRHKLGPLKQYRIGRLTFLGQEVLNRPRAIATGDTGGSDFESKKVFKSGGKVVVYVTYFDKKDSEGASAFKVIDAKAYDKDPVNAEKLESAYGGNWTVSQVHKTSEMAKAYNEAFERQDFTGGGKPAITISEEPIKTTTKKKDTYQRDPNALSFTDKIALAGKLPDNFGKPGTSFYKGPVLPYNGWKNEGMEKLASKNGIENITAYNQQLASRILYHSDPRVRNEFTAKYHDEVLKHYGVQLSKKLTPGKKVSDIIAKKEGTLKKEQKVKTETNVQKGDIVRMNVKPATEFVGYPGVDEPPPKKRTQKERTKKEVIVSKEKPTAAPEKKLPATVEAYRELARAREFEREHEKAMREKGWKK